MTKIGKMNISCLSIRVRDSDPFGDKIRVAGLGFRRLAASEAMAAAPKI